MAASKLDICNMALSEVPAQSIASLEEASQAAAECKRTYDQSLGELLERHPFRFASRRVTLASVANLRPLEWQAAYALPGDVTRINGVLPDLNGAAAGLTLLPGQRLAAVIFNGLNPAYAEMFSPTGWLVADDVLYCNLPTAVLDYATSTVPITAFPHLFAHALALEIASRVVMPILKSRERQGELVQAAQAMFERAVAEDVGQAPQRTNDFIPYDMAARLGGW